MATDVFCYQPGGQLGRLACLRSLCAPQRVDGLTPHLKKSSSRLAALVTLSIVAACGHAPTPLPEWSLADGGVLAPLVNAADTVVLLFYDPGDCFSCSSPVAEWLAWSKGGAARRVEIVLSRRPSAAEDHVLAAYRVRRVQWLADSAQIRVWPAAMVAVKGRLVDSALGRRQARTLFDRWVTTPDSSLVSGGSSRATPVRHQ